MIRSAIFPAILILAVCSCHTASAQTDTPAVSEIRHYVGYIDSVSELSYEQRSNLSSSIADGVTKDDNGNVIGGFGIYTLSNQRFDTAFRIQYHSNVHVNCSKTYYYRDNKLIYARLELRDRETGTRMLYKKEEFYNNSNVVGTKIHSVKEGEQYPAWTSLSLFKDGTAYLANFIKDNKRHY